MQKTTLFGRTTADTHPEPHAKSCTACLKLQSQLAELTLLLAQSQASLQDIVGGSENELVRQVQAELLDLREKYSALKKRVKQVEKDNDDLFAENTRIEKQLTACKTQLREYEEAPREASKQPLPQARTPENKSESGSRAETARKQQEIELFVWQEKVKQLEAINKEQGEEVARLKEYLRKRNKQQAERHRLLELYS